jgi:PAS domain S-box-containing protein
LSVYVNVRFMAIFELKYIPVPAFLIRKANQQIVSINEKAQALFDVREDKIIGQSISEFIEHRLEGPGEFSNVFLLPNKNTRIEGKLIIQEITENDQVFLLLTFLEIKKSDDRKDFYAIFKNATDGIIISDRRLTFLDVNQAFCEISGLIKEEIIGKNGIQVCKDCFPSGSATEIIDLLKKIEAGEAVSKAQFVLENKTLEISAIINDEDDYVITQLKDVGRCISHSKESCESEEQYHKLFESSKDAIMTLEPPEWKFTSGNSAIIEMFQVDSKAEFSALKPWEISPKNQPDGRNSLEKANEMIQVAMAEGSHYFDWVHRRKNKECFPATVLLTRVDLAKGAFLQATVKDVSEQKKSKEKLEESERKYRTLVESSMDSIVVVQNGIIKYSNSELSKISGFTKEELLGKEFLGFIVKDEVNKVRSYYQERLKGGNVPSRYESIAQTKSGRPFPIEANIIEIDYQGQPSEMVVLKDISARIKSDAIQNTLFEITKISFQDIGLKEYILKIHTLLGKLINADNFYIALYDRTHDKYTFPYLVDEFDKNIDSNELISLKGTLTDHILKTGKGQLITKEIEDDLFGHDGLRLVGEYSQVWIGAPLIDSSTGEAIGVIALQDYKNSDTYSNEDLVTLEIIANSIGLFIERVKRNQELKRTKDLAIEGEQRFKSLFYDNASVMLLIDPDDGSIYDVNKAACDFYGHTHADLTKMNIEQINLNVHEKPLGEKLLPENIKDRYSQLQQKLANGTVKNVELYHGNIALGDRFLKYAIVHDVTDRIATEEENIRLHKAIFKTPTPIAMTDSNGRFTYVNPSYCELSGYTEDELIGQHSRILKSGKHNKAFYKDLWDAICAGKIWKGELINQKKNGELFLEEVSITPVFNESRAITHFIKVSSDITEQRKLQDELIKAKEKAEESDRLKSAFLANMSHEIRTPMNGILGFAELLKEPWLSGEEQQKYVGIIEKSGERMLNIINDIICISKVEAGQIELMFTETNVNEQIEFISNFFLPEVEQKNVQISHNNGLPTNEAIITTDREKVYAILTNLVKNAIKFTNQGSIELGYEKKDGFLEFYVKDTGTGIREDKRQVIFERFMQGSELLSRNYEGAGLGLSISRAYAELLGGKIWVESKVGLGSCFYFTVPYNPVHKSEIVIDESENEDLIESKIKKLKILIAEDDPDSELFISLAIENFSRKTLFAGTGIEAIEICRSQSDIDLILMDIKMPEMDGYEASQKIREFNKAVVIIAQTAYALSGDREKALAAGCNEHISKPIDREELALLIRKYFS